MPPTSPDPYPVTCTLFHGVRPAVLDTWHGTWAEFVAEILPPLVASEARRKTDLPGYVLAEVEGARNDANTGPLTALAIDVDVVPDLALLLERCSRYTCAVYETPSSTPEAPRVRVIAALASPIPAEESIAARYAFAEALDLDPEACGVGAAKAHSQVMFAGRLTGTPERALQAFDGELWYPSDNLRTSNGDGDRHAARAGKPRTKSKARPAPVRSPKGDTEAEHASATPSRGAGAFERGEPDLSAILPELMPAGHDDDRHHLSRALGGWLARRGFQPEQIAEAVRRLPSDKPGERAAQALDAAQAARRGDAAPGWEYLSQRFGENGVVKRLERANRDPREPEGFDGVWSEWWASYWPRLVAQYTRKRGRPDSGKGHSKAAKLARALEAREALEARAPGLVFEEDDEGRPYETADNIYRAVRHLLDGALAFDRVAGEYALTRSVALADAELPAGLWQDVNDSHLKRELNAMRMRRPSDSDIGKAIGMLGAENKINAHGDWLHELADAWDGTPRVNGALCVYWGCANTAHVRATSRVMLLSIAARGLHPGCDVHTMPVLMGAQDALKSSSFRMLVWGQRRPDGLEYGAARRFGDSSLDLRHKDAKGSIRGMLVWELGELASLTRLESETIKAFLSSPSDKFRPPYGRNDVDCPRSVVFVGTTNEPVVNYDQTGGRRYMPVRVGTIDLAAIAADHKQLLGEAAARVLKGEQYWPTDEEKTALASAVEDVTEEDPWTADIAAWIGRNKGKRIEIRDVFDVARGPVSTPIDRRKASDARRAGHILRKLGAVQKKSNGRKLWVLPE